ncbi:MAG TPA: RNA polymerase sigma factor [Acidobacteriota bacterium]|nr:RNA polymerase sigma factor [Acidobacteriota bacterium]HNB71678.1 RNA polymerase sigma factor [Acidobacteriota bacterium]HNG91608.1 RNA polymerase sigma factor [Acidobacteriota bacterium]HNH82166.1 RNA polymerase sigma factor [Acidobacteriota bacterium]HNJ39147.1 RNA polymerase sigma factor [Acidobacteriota bacterium]
MGIFWRRSEPIETDEALLCQMMAGDEQAFARLYERRHQDVYRFALRMSGSEAIAEDVAQEVFLTLIQSGGKFDPSRGTVQGYLLGIARYRVLHRLAQDRTYVSMETPTDMSEGVPEEYRVNHHNPLADLTHSEMIEQIQQAVLGLPPHYREVVVLCNMEELSYEAAADILDCPVGTVRSRLNRARSLLQQKLSSLAVQSSSFGS